MKKKKSLLHIFLIPILVIVLVQGAVPFLTLIFSGLRTNMENTMVGLDSHMVENRKVVLENAMIEQWSSVHKNSEAMSKALAKILDEEGMDTQEFLKSEEAQDAFLKDIFSDCVGILDYNSTSGIFMILANDSPITEPASYHGFFIRDSDPQAKTASHADLLVERGNKELARDMSISLDTSWSSDFKFAGQGKRSADNFFYQPYVVAQEHKDTNMANLGYWSKPFILEDHYMDNHRMITYSVPLLYGDTIYGVMGIEIEVNYLATYFPVKDLDADLNAGVALVVDKGDGTYEGLSGEGALYDASVRGGDSFSLKKTERDELYEVEDVTVGKQKIYALIQPLNLYSRNVPYEDTQWALCGFVSEDSVFGLVSSVYQNILRAIGVSAALAAFLVLFLVRYVTKPVYRLVQSVRDGVTGIHNYQKSNIREIEELHDVVENLTDTQMNTEKQLLEEKERYRIAVETSQDVFFTYRRKEKQLEIVNSRGHDGIWNCEEHPEYLDNNEIYAADRARVYHMVKNARGKVEVDFRLRQPLNGRYQWVNLSCSVIQDKEDEDSRIVGYIHNIHQQKLLEEAQKQKQVSDALTSFYRLGYGMERIKKARQKNPKGILLLTELQHFSKLTERYGLIFGDIILEQTARIIRANCKYVGKPEPVYGTGNMGRNEAGNMESDSFGNIAGNAEVNNRNNKYAEAVYVRTGVDQVLIWLPGADAAAAQKVADGIHRDVQNLTDEKYLALVMKSSIVCAEENISTEKLMERTKNALAAAKRSKRETVCYQELSEKERKIRTQIFFEEVPSIDRLKTMKLSTMALNLFDRGGETSVVLDILALKLQEKYQITNLTITHFNREYMVNSLFYVWKDSSKYQEWDGLVHCTENEYRSFIQSCEMQQVEILNGTIQPILNDFCENSDVNDFCKNSDVNDSEIKDGQSVAFHMLDNGQYSGSILLSGISPEILKKKEECKLLDEIGMIIQNRLNLQRHDLSAQAKSDFLARMSHEIRTPMNGIIGMTEIALKEGQTEERRQDCLRKIQSSSNYLLGLINDILDMSKIESGKMKLVEEPCDLSKLLEELRLLLESKIREREIQFTEKIQLQHDWFVADALRINQVLVNLLSNAVKYSYVGGKVELTVRETSRNDGSSEVYFEVRDNGIGIPEEKQQMIFQQFEQADESENARKQGTGLGLAISSRLVRMMDSDIQLESAPGKGSTFFFTIKLQPAEGYHTDEEKKTEPLNLQEKRILIAEDNELNMEIICTILQDYGAVTESAHDGAEAVKCMETAAAGYYDLILMDIMMPVMDGLEAARKIRSINRKDCKNIPIYAMSANAFDEDVKRSLASGMNGHLSKPINIGKLEEVLQKELEKK